MHVTFVPLSGFRVREQRMLELGMTLPGLAARRDAVSELPALGLLTLAGMLPPQWTCSYRPVQRVDEAAVESILREAPDLVAVSALTASALEAYRLADRLRECGVPSVLGGLHATACAQEAERHFDAVCVGHGEPLWRRLLDDARGGRLQPRYEAGPRLTQWPLPRFDLLGDRPPRFTVQTQRGCPLACEFCGASRLLGAFAEKPAERVAGELQAIARVRRRPLIELADDNTFAGPGPRLELLDALQSSGARWFTEADWRIGEQPALLRRLSSAGCMQVLVGLESQVFHYGGMGPKRAEWERMTAAIERIQEAGVAVNGCFILGADGESRESIDRLVEWIESSPLAEVQLTLQTPFPGTALHQRLADAGRLLPERDWSFYTLFDVTYQPQGLTVEELEAGYREAVMRLFSAEATRRREAIREQVWRRNCELRL